MKVGKFQCHGLQYAQLCPVQCAMVGVHREVHVDVGSQECSQE